MLEKQTEDDDGRRWDDTRLDDLEYGDDDLDEEGDDDDDEDD